MYGRVFDKIGVCYSSGVHWVKSVSEARRYCQQSIEHGYEPGYMRLLPFLSSHLTFKHPVSDSELLGQWELERKV